MELNNLKGIGPRTIEALNRLNINNTIDLANYYPYRFNVIRPIDIRTVKNFDEVITINATIISEPKLMFIKKNLNRLKFVINTNTRIIDVTIFNRGYLKQHLGINSVVALTGKYNPQSNQFTVSDIRLRSIEKGLIEPIYHLVNGLKRTNLLKYIANAISLESDNIEDYIPPYLVKKYGFLPKLRALRVIHNPKDIEELKKSKIRLIYEELFCFMTKINYLTKINQSDNGLIRNVKKTDILNFIDSLPFSLTIDQLTTVNDIYDDLTNKKRMNRLILGDVGSGKTIVAFIAMYINYLGGYQSALMVPTEILANQHYNNVINILPPNIKIALLTGKTTKKEKAEIFNKLKNNELDIVIGTHSLINDKMEYHNLGLVITDEQHRFGVNARRNLSNKGFKPDVLYLSATPIPRTFALTIYGDMETSLIKTKPGNRLPIITTIANETNIKDVLFVVKKELDNNHQIYVVAPCVNESLDDLNDVELLKEKYLKAFPKAKIGIMHGKLKKDEKEKVINDFLNKKISILISTTVIEVGIDVENATTMIIYNAERFGLASLHQLRGRVGRNNYQSYCFLISDKKSERLIAMENSCDGFYIAEMDFKLRGEGDLFGTNQSGDMSFHLADIRRDYKILLQAKIDSLKAIENNDPVIKKIINNVEITD